MAIPAKLSEVSVRAIQNAGIELWDLDAIGTIFRDQIASVEPDLSLTFKPEVARSREMTLIDELRSCTPGRTQWSIYQKLIGRVIEHLFCPPLSAPLSESPDESGVNRRDFVLANFADDKFWAYIRARYSADYIVVDAKNYVGKVKKRDVLQMANYLKHHGTGLFGIIFTRNGADASARITAREQWAHYSKLVIVLNDLQCEAMLHVSKRSEATSVIAKEIQDFRLAM